MILDPELEKVRQLHRENVIQHARTANQIIIVEDDPVNAELMEIRTRMLNPTAVVVVATNLQEARTAVWRADQNTVVFCDYNFPEGIIGAPEPNARGVYIIAHAKGLPFAITTSESRLTDGDRDLEPIRFDKTRFISALKDASKRTGMGGVLSDTSGLNNARPRTADGRPIERRNSPRMHY